MKRYSISVVLHILLLVILSIGGYLLFHYELWFSTLIVTLLLIATGVHLYSIQMRLAGMMRRLTDSIRFNDMTQSFQPPFKSRMMVELADELSQTLKLFRGRLLEEEVKHQYYENLLSKVDTAVMVTDRSGRRMDESCGCGFSRARNPIASGMAYHFLERDASSTHPAARNFCRNGCVLHPVCCTKQGKVTGQSEKYPFGIGT